MIKIDHTEVVEMQIKFPHSNFNVAQFGFGYLTLRKGERSFKLDTYELEYSWKDDAILVLDFFLPESLEEDEKQDLTSADLLSELDEAELWVDEGSEDPDPLVDPISAALIVKHEGKLYSIALSF